MGRPHRRSRYGITLSLSYLIVVPPLIVCPILRSHNKKPLNAYAFAQRLETQGKEEYRKLLTQIPILFGVAWVLLLIVAVERLAIALLRCAFLLR